MIKGKVVIAGDSIVAGIDLEDAKEGGEIKLAMVVTFDTMEDMRKAQRGDTLKIGWE